nr:MAG TPA: helix-turn-helix domain protein [Caudoviricetes sp.]
MFYDNFINLCKRKKIAPSKAAIDAGFSKSLVSKWKANPNTVPTVDVLKKISDYFGITVDELLGKEKQPTEGELHPANKKLMELSRTLSPEEAEKVYKAISLLLEK